MRIALYIDDGVSAGTVNHWLLMAKEGLIDEFETVKAKDITHDKLLMFNWLILPGGSGSGICSKLNQDNRNDLEKAIKSGLNVMGICAGGYALSNGYDWSLSLIDYKTVDTKNWKRGKGFVDVKFSSYAKQLLKLKKDKMEVFYNNGPVFEKKKAPKNHKVLATFESDMVAEGGQVDLMPGSIAILHTKVGKGNILTISPHFEKTPISNKLIKKLLKQYL